MLELLPVCHTAVRIDNSPNRVVIVLYCYQQVTSMTTTVTPCQATRKSARTIRKPNRMDDDVVTPNPMGAVINPAHDLMIDTSTPKKLLPTSKAKRMIRVLQVKCSKPVPCTDDVSTMDEESTSISSDDSNRYHRSDNYTKTHLYDKWMVAKDNSRDLQQKNSDLLTTIHKLKKELAFADKTVDIVRDTKKKLRSSVESVSKLKSEKQSLTDTVTSLNRDYTQLIESKGNDKSHCDATLKLKVATLIQNHKCNVTELELIQKRKDLTELANQEEIKPLEEIVATNQTKLKIMIYLLHRHLKPTFK